MSSLIILTCAHKGCIFPIYLGAFLEWGIAWVVCCLGAIFMPQKAHTSGREVFSFLHPPRGSRDRYLSSLSRFSCHWFSPRVFLANGNEGTEDYHLVLFLGIKPLGNDDKVVGGTLF